jgi:nucleoside triphosphate diphosphatase
MSDAVAKLLEIMTLLRDKDKGCPWDLEQTMQSIVPHTLEEAYELADAIESNNMDDVKKECGDLLFQVIFYAQIAKENHGFDFNDICLALTEKLRRRHPHIFSDAIVANAHEQTELWEAIKGEERSNTHLLADIPKNLPSLSRAQKIQKRAATVGFDWDNIEDVVAKMEEEIVEIKQALKESKQAASEELGDLLFACANLARWLDKDCEQILRQGINKFERRFNEVEQKVASSQQPWSHYNIDQLEQFWQEVKIEEKQR